MRKLVIGLLCTMLMDIAWAEDFTRDDIDLMHEAGVSVSNDGGISYHVIASDAEPAELIQTYSLNYSGKSLKRWGVPEWLGKFTQLRELDLSNTGLHANKKLHDAISNMGDLEYLDLSGNPLFSKDGDNLAGLWSKLPNLRTLKLANTNGVASDYGYMGSLNSLIRLDLSDNEISGSLESLGISKLPLRELNLSNNEITDSFMFALPIGQDSQLTELDLSGNDNIRISDEYDDYRILPKLKTGLKIDDDAMMPDVIRKKCGSCSGKSSDQNTARTTDDAASESSRNIDTASSRESSSSTSGQYRINGDGTVTDTKTGLMWKRCSEGQSGDSCGGTADKYKWDDAMSKFGSGFSFAGYSDWRMPTKDELKGLVYCSNGAQQEVAWDDWCSGKDNKAGEYEKPTINQTAFPNTASSSYWSSTAEDASSACHVNFTLGYDGWHARGDDDHVRLVRSGQ